MHRKQETRTLNKKNTIMKKFLLSLFILIMISLDYLMIYEFISIGDIADNYMLIGIIITMTVGLSTLPIYGLIDGFKD